MTTKPVAEPAQGAVFYRLSESRSADRSIIAALATSSRRQGIELRAGATSGSGMAPRSIRKGGHPVINEAFLWQGAPSFARSQQAAHAIGHGDQGGPSTIGAGQNLHERSLLGHSHRSGLFGVGRRQVLEDVVARRTLGLLRRRRCGHGTRNGDDEGR